MPDNHDRLNLAITLVEQFEAHIAAAAAYKAKAVEAGFSDSAAEEMALEFHSMLIQAAAKS